MPAPTPAAPVPPVATPAQTATLQGRRGRMTFRVQRLPEPLLLEQDTIDPRYNNFRSWMMVIGGISVFLIFGTLMFWMGEWKSSSTSGASVPVAIIQPATTVAPSPATTYVPPGTTKSPYELSPEELDKRHSEYLRNQDR